MAVYTYVWAEPNGTHILRHAEHGKQNWKLVANLAEPVTCATTGDQLLQGWLAYAPVDEQAPNATDRIGGHGMLNLVTST